MSYTIYVILENGQPAVRKCRGFKPGNVIGTLPPDTASSDFEYVRADIQEDSTYVVYIDQLQKSNDIPSKEAKELATKTNKLRQTRTVMLQQSDWTQMPDAPLTSSEVIEWQTYRQALRDFPENVVDIDNPIWPTKP